MTYRRRSATPGIRRPSTRMPTCSRPPPTRPPSRARSRTSSGNPLGADDTWTLHDRRAVADRHHQCRLRRGSDRRRHLCLADRQRRGDPEADRGVRVRWRFAAGRLDERALVGRRRRRRSPAGTCTSTAPAPARPRPMGPGAARVRRDLHGGARSRPSASPPISTPRHGRPSAPRATASSTPAPTTARSPPRRRCRSSLLGSSHRYRIEWDAGEVRFFVDGAPVATHTVALRRQHAAAEQRLQARWRRALGRLAADEPVSGVGELRLAGPRRRPERATGAPWHGPPRPRPAPAWRSASAPATRRPPTDAGAPSAPIAASGGDIPGSSRYVQYRAALTQQRRGQHARAGEVSIGYARPAPDVTPPTISQRTPAPDATGVATGANVAVQFSEVMDPATIDGSTCACASRAPAPTFPPASATPGSPRRSIRTPTSIPTPSTRSPSPARSRTPAAIRSAPTTPGPSPPAGQALGFTDTTFADFSAGDDRRRRLRLGDRRRRGDPEAGGRGRVLRRTGAARAAGRARPGVPGRRRRRQRNGLGRQPARRRRLRRHRRHLRLRAAGSSSPRPSARRRSSMSA